MALRRLLCTPRLSLHRVGGPFRCLSAGTPTAEEAASQLRAELGELDDVLTSSYGASPETAADFWMQSYYKHHESRLLAPAVARLLVANQEASFDPTTEAQTALFVGVVLQSLPPADARRLFAQLCISKGVGPDFVLAATRVGGEGTADCFNSLKSTVEVHKEARDYAEFAEHLLKVPVSHVLDWPVPTTDEAFQVNWKSEVSPFEFTANLTRIKETLTDFHDWGLLCTSLLLEASWATFYATGDRRCIRRVMDVATPWVEFQDDLGVDYILQLDKQLPKELTSTHDSRSIAAQTSRVAMWSLLMHSRAHSGVLGVLGEEVARLSPFVVSPFHRDEEDMAIAGLTPEDAKNRLSLFPALVHLVARANSDAEA